MALQKHCTVERTLPNPKTQLSPPTQMLQRHLDRLAGQDILVAGCPADNGVSLLSQQLRTLNTTFVTFDYAAYLKGKAALDGTNNRHSIIFSSWYENIGEKHDLAVVYLQKGRELNEMVLSMIRPTLRPGAKLFLVGENDAGIRSYRRTLHEAVGTIVYSDAARHCVLYQALFDLVAPNTYGTLGSWVREYQLALGGQRLSIASLPGVFSQGRIDIGTAFLLEHVELPESGDVLDFGCGSGVIGAFVKSVRPLCNVTLVDSNAFAIVCSTRTFAGNSLSAVRIVPSDVFSSLGDSYDFIISNPPFHQGIGTDYEAVTKFISEAAHHLRDHGTLVIVANKFLKYEPLLSQHVGPTVVAAQNGAYKIFVTKRDLTHRGSVAATTPPVKNRR